MKRMNTIINILTISLLLSFCVETQSRVFDVRQYGGRAGENVDISPVLLKAWKDACASAGLSKIWVPKGIYGLRQLDFAGPCKGSIEFQVEGTLKAPARPEEVPGDSWVRFSNVDHLHLFGGGTFDGQGQIAWKENNCGQNANCKALPKNLRFDFVTNSIVQSITSLNSKNFHINILGCRNLTLQHVTVTAPKESLNTDGIHIGHSNGVQIYDTNIGTGDDCVSLGDGSRQITIRGVNCGPGHGISVGSLGRYPNEEPVFGVYVSKCTFSNTENGLRIKSWPASFGGTASNMHFEDIIMNNVGNPILIDQNYCPWNQCSNKAPSKVKISDISFKGIRGTSSTPLAVKLHCSSGIPCENVELSDINLAYKGKGGPPKSECTYVKLKYKGNVNPPGC